MLKKSIAICIALCFIVLPGISQDSIRTKQQIDSTVLMIERTGMTNHLDSIIQDNPESGLYTKTYMNLGLLGKEVKKYVNLVYSTRTEQGKTKQTKSANTFYFDHGKLIKVEEYMIEDTKRIAFDWYYQHGRLVYTTAPANTAKERGPFLLKLATNMQELWRTKWGME